MAGRDRYAPGTFCAVDLETSDADGAKRFYGGLFGWEPEDVSPGEGMTYTILRLHDDAVAGMYEPPADRREAGIPPHWLNYVSVESADEAGSRAAELGAEVLSGPFDILDVGRMAILRDPTGATFAVWQAGKYPGAARVNEPGSLTWNELATTETGAALEFYSALFGWTSEAMPTGDGPSYDVVRVGERTNGGVRPLSPEEEQAGIPPYWVPYFGVESLDGAFDRAAELGGTKVFGPMPMPTGRIGALRDPQGAALALWEGEYDD